MNTRVCVADIKDGLESHDQERLQRALEGVHPADAARIIGTFPPDQIAAFVGIVGVHAAREAFQFLPFETQEKVLEILSPDILGHLVTLLSPDDRADLFEKLDPDFRERLLSLLIRRERQEIMQLLTYPDDSAGAYMTTDYASLSKDLSIPDALDQLRIQAPTRETIYYAYVVDGARHLIGFVSLQDLILAPRHSRVEKIMHREVISVNVKDDIEEVAKLMSHYDFLAVPVVDEERRLVGIITHDDILDVVQEEATEDMYRLASLDTNERIDSPIPKSVRLRLPWLLLNLGTSLIAASAVSFFSQTIEQVVALASMMTVVATLGGNSGNQALTIVVRSMALEEGSLRNKTAIVLKSLGVGLVNGLICGLAVALLSYAWFGNGWLSALVCLAMTLNLASSGLFGALVPITLRKLKLDPALGSSVLLTTITDTGGFLILLGLATLFVRQLMA